MSLEHERSLLFEVGNLHKTITDIDAVLKGPAADFALEDLGEVVESRTFFEARRQTIIAQLAGESLIAAQRAA